MFSALKLSRTHIRPSKRTLFNYAKTFIDGLYLLLSSKSSSSILFCHDIDAAWFQLKSNILKARDHAVPTYTISLHSSPKWFNSNLRHLLNKIHSLHSLIKSKSTPSSSLVSKLSQIDSIFHAQVHLAKHIQTLINQYHSTSSKLNKSPKIIA